MKPIPNLKAIFIIISLLQLPSFLYSQFFYEIGDTLTILAKSGLHLRDSASTNSPSLKIIKFGEKVIAKSLLFGREELEDRTGSWIQVESKGKTGFAFSGFLTKAKILKFNRKKYCNYNSARWWEDLIRMNVDTVLCQGSREYRGFDPDKGGKTSVWELFKNETLIYHVYEYESSYLVVETNELNMNDLLNLLEYYISTTENCNGLSAPPKDREDIPINIKKEKFGYSNLIKTIECETINFYAEKSINKTIFRIFIEGS